MCLISLCHEFVLVQLQFNVLKKEKMTMTNQTKCASR